MRRVLMSVVSGLLLLLPVSLALGQTKPAPAEAWQTVFFESPGIAIPRLTAAAIQRSAAIKSIDVDRATTEQDLIITRRNILGSLGLGGGYNYGNLATIGGVDGGPGIGTTNQGRYSVGVNFGLPLNQVLTRGNLITKEKLNLQRIALARQGREDAIRQQIIELYQGVVLARKVLTFRQEAYVGIQTNYQLAERQFRQGQLPLQALTQASGALTEASIAQASARNSYDTAFLLLEEIVGAKISTLMTTR